MKMNISVRLKNPWFWVGVASVVITATGVDAAQLTSWGAVLESVNAVLHNPVQLAAGALAVLSVFVDPTTAGLGDSADALTYNAPRKDGDKYE